MRGPPPRQAPGPTALAPRGPSAPAVLPWALCLWLGLACAPAPSAPAPEPPSPLPAADLRAAAAETLCQFAGRQGVAADAVARANGLGPDARLEEGALLRVPHDASPAVYRVARGDTLSWIASWSGVPVASLAAGSGIEDPDRLEVGDEVRLPPGAATACAPPRPSATALRRTPTVPRETSAGPGGAAGSRESRGASGDPGLRDARAGLARSYASYASANYALAKAEATGARDALDGRSGSEARRLRARASLLEGLAALGMGSPETARTAFAQGLAEDPALEIDPELASPKVVELFEAARRAAPTPE